VVSEPTPTAAAEFADDGWKIYRNEKRGYSFHYPADANISTADDPLKTLTILGPVMGNDNWPVIYVSHPSDREEYRPPEGVNLEKWLIDHYLWTPNDQGLPTCASLMPDSGTMAIPSGMRAARSHTQVIHTIFARSGQLRSRNPSRRG
jgi:hypothetical protein